MSKQKYIGITIGPIVKTLMLTSTPAGLWGASYLFSRFTKELIGQLQEKLQISEHSFLVPVINENVKGIIKGCPWAGLFHDRIIFQTDLFEMEKINLCIEDTKEMLAKGIIDVSLEKAKAEEKAKEYIKNYLQIHIIEKEVEEGKNPILALSPNLDVLELGQSYIPKEDKNYLLDFLENRDNLEQKKAENRNQNIKTFTSRIYDNKESAQKWHFFQ